MTKCKVSYLSVVINAQFPNALQKQQTQSPQERAQWLKENYFQTRQFVETKPKSLAQWQATKEPLNLTPAEQEMADDLGL